MKRFLIVTLVCGAAAILAGCASLTPQEKARISADVERQLAARDFTIDVRTANPASWRPIQLSPGFSLRVQGDRVYSYLPYFGRVYMSPVRISQGLNFMETIQDYKQVQGKRGDTEIQFSVILPEDTYTFRITVSVDGSSTIFVNGYNRQSISFLGDVRV